MTSMNYMELMKQQKQDHVALIEDGTPYTYGELVERAVWLSKEPSVFPEAKLCAKTNQPQIHFIRRQTILEQLTEFFAASERGEIPVIVPYDAKLLPEYLPVPERACMGVMTSGTTGKPKVLFRSYESWADFFPIQNEVFQISRDSRLFVQGSLAFTGNLNLYMAQFYAGAVIVANNRFQPKKWEEIIEREQVNAIYLIPSKLMCLPRVINREHMAVRQIISGSQSLGREEARELKQIFPSAQITLYYGASELNYITYVTDNNMTGQKDLIGKPFPQVAVEVREGEIYVDTPYHVEGIRCPYTLSDCGYLDEEGNLHFSGRSDDIINIRGRKVSSFRIEEECKKLPGVVDAAVLAISETWQRGRRYSEETHAVLTAFLVLEDVQKMVTWYREQQGYFLGEINDPAWFGKLRDKLAHFEMPGKLIVLEKMPVNESGKTDKKCLEKEWMKQWNLQS